jgi:hypothetical protein
MVSKGDSASTDTSIVHSFVALHVSLVRRQKLSIHPLNDFSSSPFHPLYFQRPTSLTSITYVIFYLISPHSTNNVTLSPLNLTPSSCLLFSSIHSPLTYKYVSFALHLHAHTPYYIHCFSNHRIRLASLLQ